MVVNNVFHDIYAYSYGGWGLYTDEGSSNILFENNLVYRVKTGGFHQHYGRENIVRNNILAFSKLHQLQATRVEDHLSFTLENNIVYWDTGELLAGRWDEVKHDSRNNCYWNAAGEAVRFRRQVARRSGRPPATNRARSSPTRKFEDPQRVRLPRWPPIRRRSKLGFKPFDYTQAGVYGDPAWIRKAAEATYPPLRIAPDPPGPK